MSGSAFARLPQALRLLRKRRGWTQRELAAAVGFTVKQVSAYETGRQRPRIETLERILDQLQANARVLAQTMAAFDERRRTGGDGRPRRALRLTAAGRARRDGKPQPVGIEGEARPSSRDTLRSLAERLPALRMLADELALDMVNASAERRAGGCAERGRTTDGAGTEPAKPREAE